MRVRDQLARSLSLRMLRMSPLWSAKVEADVLGILQDVTNRGQTREAAWEGAMMVCVELVTATASSQRSVWTSTRGCRALIRKRR
jgi:hypothetical protein